MSERNVTFTVKEGPNGEPRVAVEFYGPRSKAEVYLDLRPEAGLDRAHEIARLLRSEIIDVRLGGIS